MGTFSPAHWAIFIVLLAGLVYFAYLVGSLIWAGAKATGSKWKVGVIVVLAPIVIFFVVSVIGAYKVTIQANPFDDPNYGMDLLKR